MKKNDNQNSFETILYLLLNSIKEKADEYTKKRCFNNLYTIQNYLIFFMIISLNLKNYPNYMKAVFKSQLDFFHKLVEILFSIKKKRKFLYIINNLFLEEYKQLFFNENSTLELEEIFINEQTFFAEKYSDPPLIYEKDTYVKIFSKLLNFDLSYKDLFSKNSDEIDIEDKIAYKLAICQSLIRTIFSKEKNKYINEEFYEYNILKKVIDKDMEETLEKYGDEYKTLFRKEDICDDFLKYMFFIFGNNMIIESFINPLNKILENVETDRNINQDEFDKLVNEFLIKSKNNFAYILKILLKILYESVLAHFTIQKDNYGPLYTTLIFNFIISPRVQIIYNINSHKNLFIRSLNRLLRNACFNFKFNEDDPLNSFNESIEKNHLKIKNYIEDNILGIEIEDKKVKSSLGDIFNEKYIIYPKFLFYWDTNIIFKSIHGGVKQFIEFEKLKIEKES